MEPESFHETSERTHPINISLSSKTSGDQNLSLQSFHSIPEGADTEADTALTTSIEDDVNVVNEVVKSTTVETLQHSEPRKGRDYVKELLEMSQPPASDLESNKMSGVSGENHLAESRGSMLNVSDVLVSTTKKHPNNTTTHNADGGIGLISVLHPQIKEAVNSAANRTVHRRVSNSSNFPYDQAVSVRPTEYISSNTNAKHYIRRGRKKSELVVKESRHVQMVSTNIVSAAGHRSKQGEVQVTHVESKSTLNSTHHFETWFSERRSEEQLDHQYELQNVVSNGPWPLFDASGNSSTSGKVHQSTDVDSCNCSCQNPQATSPQQRTNFDRKPPLQHLFTGLVKFSPAADNHPENVNTQRIECDHCPPLKGVICLPGFVEISGICAGKLSVASLLILLF
ncbi:unnamed protein product [Soboliphyme baturini]|uniref:Pecanex-like protein n=1 Tax=Soboliphyme baturini TaxID=241478 RepID=A0A183J3A0_9BILA|nr:unnamed protein product [Soboliphyme baturini]